MRAGDDHRPDLRRDEPAKLGDHALDRPLRLGVRVEEVAGDEDDVDLLGDREIDRRPERGELSLTLGGRLLAEVRVTRAEMDVSGVEESEHPVGLASCAVAGGRRLELAHRIPGRPHPELCPERTPADAATSRLSGAL